MNQNASTPATAPAGNRQPPRDGLSHVKGDTSAELSPLTIPAFLAQAVAQGQSREAVVFREQNVRWNWNEFAERIDELAAALLALGVERGDRVGIWAPNRVEWLVTQFATARIGSVLVNINPAYRL
ncbi:MAG TPA: AMP-binding protein, partial [Burkholderiaceae bacterium]|nr:AMP-binding protein [Burkholderiaceae bacterium]